MTISKKLALIISLALGMQFATHAFFNHNTKNEKALILNFAQDIRQSNNTQAQAIAKWLDEQVISGSWYHSTIIDVITDKNLTENTKLTLLSEMIAKQKIDRVKEFVANVCGSIMCVGFCGVVLWAIIEDAKNPRPRPKVTVTYRVVRQPEPHIVITWPNFDWLYS